MPGYRYGNRCGDGGIGGPNDTFGDG